MFCFREPVCFEGMDNDGICSIYELRGETCIDDLPNECLLNVVRFLMHCADQDAFGLTCQRWLKIQNEARCSIKFQFRDMSAPNCTKYLSKLLDRFPALISVSLVGCTEISDSALALFPSAGLKLKSILLDCCFSITDDGLSHICNNSKGLSSLSLYRCNISDIGLEHVARSCPNLEIINLSYCANVSDSGIAALGEGCLGLKIVNISFCKNIQGIGFKKCLFLQYLDADSCRLTDDGLCAIPNGSSLQYLNLSHSRNLIDLGSRGFSCIGMACSNLQFLHTRMCRTLDDSAVIEISRGCPLLKEWNLAVCPQVTVVGWKEVALNCRNLEILHVNRCRHFCNRSLLFLRSGCPKLSSLYMHGCPNLNPLTVELFKQARCFVRIILEENMCAGFCVDEFVKNFAVKVKTKTCLVLQ
ncbi:hypothetical protein SUGI_0205190 [Cryptomeria japonica]|uniref:F-box/LRR-repeat protein 12 n=1 Tax=Cryptomeria japonica TaxID=3369 RepID=UPI0024089686|nr:F-box/LRR-repeat protein 12 [Cryptomeria japonica]GLJ13102.1 hypothetical protein SUGI_0205190 [Cryptomeria japonica]